MEYVVAMHLHSLFLLQAVTSCLTFYDIELEGFLKLGQDLLNKLKESQPNYTDPFVLNPPQFVSNNPVVAYLRTGEFVPTRAQQLMEYIFRIEDKGKKMFENMGKHIKEEMRITKDLTHLITNVSNDFRTKIKKHYNLAIADKPEYEIDEEFIFLDLVETANRLLYGEGRKLLHDIVVEVNDKNDNADFRLINKNLYKESITSKREEILHICFRYQICRQFPSFTDYSADFISDILKMSDEYFKKMIDIFKNFFNNNSVFFSSLIRDEDKELIVAEYENFSNNVSHMREFLSVLRAVMTQRFKLVHNSNEMLKARTKAVRIILDIIDKALSSQGEDLLSIDISNTVHAVRLWTDGQRNDIDQLFGRFLEYVAQTLNYVFSKDTRTEIQILIQVLLRGRTDRESEYDYLNTIGSKFVRGEDIKNEIRDIL